jgi:hypothetical protein
VLAEHLRSWLLSLVGRPLRPRGSVKEQRRVRRQRRYNALDQGDLARHRQEIGELFDIHKNAVLPWRREGLSADGSLRPYLTCGDGLPRLLDQRQYGKRRQYASSKCFFFKYRAPGGAYLGIPGVPTAVEHSTPVMSVSPPSPELIAASVRLFEH